MNNVDYQDFYNNVGKQNGWDFSKLKVKIEGNKLELFDEIVKYCTLSQSLLDIGTGGGELLLTISKNIHHAIGIDLSPEMIVTAKKNAKQLNVTNVEFYEMSASDLHLLQQSFDIITCRQAPFDVGEINQVLKPNGLFITQQVSEHDKLNLKQAFQRGQSYGVESDTLKHFQIEQLRNAGFKIIEVFDYNVTEYYETPEDLIFLLKHTPIIEHFGKGKEDFDILNSFISENITDKGIKTNSARYIILAKKLFI